MDSVPAQNTVHLGVSPELIPPGYWPAGGTMMGICRVMPLTCMDRGDCESSEAELLDSQDSERAYRRSF